MSVGHKTGKCTRRQLILRTSGAATLAPFLPNFAPFLPSSDEVTRELAELAANIPGLGQADVFYPSFFKGEWKVRRPV